MSGSDTYIKAIKGGIVSIKNGTKTPVESNVGKNLNRLKAVNEGMYTELLEEYKEVMKKYNEKD